MQRFLLALTATGIGLFALIKPVHIDDTVVLHVAQNILHDPLRPFAGDFFWLEEPQPLAQVTTNPPLVSYWLAPWIALAGYREWVLHLSFAPFLALLMWGMHRLATRWLGASWAWWAVGWLMLSPAVLPGMNLMRDVPALALLVGGLACWVEGVERRGARWLLMGALLTGLAGLAKYTALIGIPLIGLYALQRRAYGALGWLPIALTPIAGWSAWNLWVDGQVHLLYLWQERRGGAPWTAKLLPGIVGLGASTLLFVGGRRWFIDALGQGWRWKVALLVAIGGLALWGHLTQFAGQPVYEQTLVWLLAGATVLGLALLASAPDDAAPVSRFLRVWLLIALAAAVWGVPFQAMRHLLYALPPLILLLTLWVGRNLNLLLAQGVLCLAVIAADYDYAVRYKRGAAAYAELFRGERVWYAGSWGWMFYAEQQGFRKLLPDGAGLQRGDIVVIPERVYKGKTPPDLHRHLVLLDETPCLPTLPLRTMDFRGAAYYALIRTNAPFRFSLHWDEPLEIRRAYRWTPPR
ncbi:MAG: glycosyltransferase family 39 protein [Fimbriimonadales bacterium]|nr:MAG: hypothetical protein KatS3mg018_1644 [Fimbriimonadales bacterium]